MRPLDRSHWNERTAAHLLNRAGFGATPAEIQAAAARDPRGVVDELVDYPGKREIPLPTFLQDTSARERSPRIRDRGLSEEERRRRVQEAQRSARQHLLELRGWWLFLMRHTRHPLQEKLTLFWHGHFATSQDKVKPVLPLFNQNQLFREHGHGNWENLLVRISQDPAMLIYLDNARSSARQPNENYARELLELFSLGEGHYTEEDIRAAARAFTGWSLDQEEFTFRERAFMHDDGEKTFLGRSGRLGGRDILTQILAQREAPRFICRKLWEFFAHAAPDETLVDELAARLKGSGYELKPLLKEMFLSEAFYGPKSYRTQIKGPVQWLVGFCRSLDCPLPTAPASVFLLRSLGQELFAPPNVKGWDGGPAWITSANLLNRYNLAGLLLKGGAGMSGETLARLNPVAGGEEDPAMMREDDPVAGFRERARQRVEEAVRRQEPILNEETVLPSPARASRAAARDHLINLLFQDPLREKDRKTFDDYLARQPEPSAWTREHVADALHLLMSTPQYQLT